MVGGPRPGEPDGKPGEKPSEQGENPQQTQFMYGAKPESNADHICERRAFSL